jgi:hypothetical protein
VDSAAPQGATVSYRVFALDVSGNRSAGSNELTLAVCPAVEAPAALQLRDPWPNPFEGAATIPLDVPPEQVGEIQRLLIFDAAGRTVRVLFMTPEVPGRIEFAWDGRNESGHRAAPGLYLVRLAGGGKGVFVVKKE